MPLTHNSGLHQAETQPTEATTELLQDPERQPVTEIHRLPPHKPETAATRTVRRPRDCTPKDEIHSRHYGIMPTKQYPSLLKARIQSTEATTKPLQAPTHYPVPRLSSSEDTELKHSIYISDSIKMSNYKHYFLSYIASLNPEYRTAANSRHQPDPAVPTLHVRSLHHRQDESQNTTHQSHSNKSFYYIIMQIYQTLKPEKSEERQTDTEDRHHTTVHRSTALRGMLSDTRLTVAPPKTTCETHRQCIKIKMQRGQTRIIHSIPEGVDRQQSVTIISTHDYSTKTANFYRSPSPPSHTCRLIPRKNGRSSNFRHKNQG